MRRANPVLRTIVAVVAALVVIVPVAGDATLDNADSLKAIVVVVDGLEPETVSPVLTPNLWALVENGEARRYGNALANMITETNANHAAMMTGSYPESSGMVANGFYNTRAGAEESMDRPSLIADETLFDAIEGQDSTMKTAAVMGKAKLRKLFGCTEVAPGYCGPSDDNPEGELVNHVRPDFLLGAHELGDDFDPDAHDHAAAEPLTGSGYALDNDIMDIAIDLQRAEDPDFTFVNLGDVDGFQHLFGARSPEGRASVVNADALIGQLVDALREEDDWKRTVLIVTADHSFQDTGDPVGPPSAPEAPDLHVAQPVTPHFTGSAIDLSAFECSNGTEIAAVTHGGSASVYVDDASYDAYTGATPDTAQQECLAEIRAQALATDGVDEALYRLANPTDGGDAHTIANVHPDWRLATPRTGDLLITATNDAWIVESRASSGSVVTGNHGGPSARPIPFVVASGASLVDGGEDAENLARPIDIAPTVAALLGVAPPSDAVGRVLTEAITLGG